MVQVQQPNVETFTATDAMIACDIDNETQFQGMTQAQRFANDIFSNSFDILFR